jgi:crossover junction endodeoxyribonuclease RuvC
MDSKKVKRILGIDPGYGRVGWGVIEGHGSDWQHIAHGCIDTDKRHTFVRRLLQIERELNDIISEHQPNFSSVEQIFFSKNVTTGIDVSQARGVILLTLAHHKIPIAELTPTQIKQALTGYGNAEKRQVQEMVQRELSMKELPKQDDAADALAVAITAGLYLRVQ